jgi:hypothetical protein
MSANRELSWRQLDDGEVEVSTLVGGIAPACGWASTSQGLIKARIRDAAARGWAGPTVDTPWVGEFATTWSSEGSWFRGRRGAWELPDGPFAYWRGELTSLVAE